MTITGTTTVAASPARGEINERLHGLTAHLDVWGAPVLIAVLCVLSLLRPVDHDESQYVAATVLTAHGLLPYRDFAYLQTPLQPLLLAPAAWLAGAWTWPVLRLLNAALAGAAVLFSGAAARRFGANAGWTQVAMLLFASCDILLFCAGTARNDALPAACLAAAIWLSAAPTRADLTNRRAFIAALLLAAAAATKLSYAFPAAAFGLWALVHHRRRVPWIAAGVLPIVIVVALLAALAPQGFLFGTYLFPARAPAEFYATTPELLTLFAKLRDTATFLAFGAALPVLVLVLLRTRRFGFLELMLLAGAIGALLPQPTWRQYLLPILPPLFILAAIRFTVAPPRRITLIVVAAFVALGLLPTARAIKGTRLPTLARAMGEGRALGRELDRLGIGGPVVTLTPEILPSAGRAPSANFAAGPFYWRSRDLVDASEEAGLHLVSRYRPRLTEPAVVVGLEPDFLDDDPRLDDALADAALAAGYRPAPVPGTTLKLFVRSTSPTAADGRPPTRRYSTEDHR